MTYLISNYCLLGFLCALAVLLYINKLRRRNKQDTFEWREGDTLEICYTMYDTAKFIGFNNKYVIVKRSWCHDVNRVSLWQVKCNVSLDERKAKEYMKFREELHKETT